MKTRAKTHAFDPFCLMIIPQVFGVQKNHHLAIGIVESHSRWDDHNQYTSKPLANHVLTMAYFYSTDKDGGWWSPWVFGLPGFPRRAFSLYMFHEMFITDKFICSRCSLLLSLTVFWPNMLNLCFLSLILYIETNISPWRKPMVDASMSMFSWWFMMISFISHGFSTKNILQDGTHPVMILDLYRYIFEIPYNWCQIFHKLCCPIDFYINMDQISCNIPYTTMFKSHIPFGKQTACYWTWPSRNRGFTQL